MKRIPGLILIAYMVLMLQCSVAQPLSQKQKFTRQDTLRGSITPERAWWDVQRYDISVTPDINTQTIVGTVRIQIKKINNTSKTTRLQIDLQQPMVLDHAIFNVAGVDKQTGRSDGKNYEIPMQRDGNVYYLEMKQIINEINPENSLVLSYHGKPRSAVNPPWDGGWIWKKDAKNRPWISVACQGLGASVWYPCKDHQSDEPDAGASINVNVPDSLVAIANGKLISKKAVDGKTSYTWAVINPINNYTIIPYIGYYTNWTETYNGEKGKLNCSYWVLDYELEKAKKQFTQVPQMLKAFEHWFGPYPFYEDDFKLVQSPHLGMEHQSAIAYGNRFLNGYLGNDLSGTGWGLKWDYIIVHESGHEWFANNITTKDIADMWVHEGFTDYSETLFTEYYYGKEAGNAYVQGIRKNIANDKPIIGPYNINQEGSSDMYYKGANLLHTVRQVIDNDSLFRNILRGLNKTFYHQTVTTTQVEDYISKQSGKNLSKVFDQYLRTTRIPVLELKTKDDKLECRWTNCIDGFNMPVKLTNGLWIEPKAEWTKLKADNADLKNIEVDKNFYVSVKKV